jgi:hypothetical protein
VFVHEDQLELARSLLLADAVDAAFDERYNELGPEDAYALDLPPVDLPTPTKSRRTHTALVFLMVGLVFVLAFVTSFH